MVKLPKMVVLPAVMRRSMSSCWLKPSVDTLTTSKVVVFTTHVWFCCKNLLFGSSCCPSPSCKSLLIDVGVVVGLEVFAAVGDEVGSLVGLEVLKTAMVGGLQ